MLTVYGERAAADRATERAFEASGADGRQLSATIFDASRRALVTGNLQAGRKSTLRALEASLPADEMVYVALWLLLLERKSGVPSDGTVEEALASFDDANGWYSKLRSWARGKLDDAGLVNAAQSRVEKTEALFYVSMNRYVRGDKSAAADLKKVADSEAYDLFEVGIARDVLATERPTPFKLPANVSRRDPRRALEHARQHCEPAPGAVVSQKERQRIARQHAPYRARAPEHRQEEPRGVEPKLRAHHHQARERPPELLEGARAKRRSGLGESSRQRDSRRLSRRSIRKLLQSRASSVRVAIVEKPSSSTQTRRRPSSPECGAGTS